MTERQLARLAKQLRAGAQGYATLQRAFERAAIGDSAAITRARENIGRLRQELEEQAYMAENAPPWLREVVL